MGAKHLELLKRLSKAVPDDMKNNWLLAISQAHNITAAEYKELKEFVLPGKPGLTVHIPSK